MQYVFALLVPEPVSKLTGMGPPVVVEAGSSEETTDDVMVKKASIAVLEMRTSSETDV